MYSTALTIRGVQYFNTAVSILPLYCNTALQEAQIGVQY